MMFRDFIAESHMTLQHMQKSRQSEITNDGEVESQDGQDLQVER